MSLEQNIADLVTATTSLTEAVNVKKEILDEAVIKAQNAADSVQIKEQEREQIFEDAQEERENEFSASQIDKQSRFNDFIASSGYQFLGDYAAGIEITEYNQIIRDADGEFWRLSGQEELPYTTTGVGLPEDDALTPLGDAVLRQELANPDKGAAMVAYHDGSVADKLEEIAQGAFMSGYLSEWETVDLRTGAKPSRFVLGSVFGKLIAVTEGGSLRESVDGITWSDFIVHASSFPFTVGGNILEMSDGEVLIWANNNFELWKSNGWQTNPSTASWSKSVECESYPSFVNFHTGWGVRVSGNYVIAAEYGIQGGASNVYLSTDAGSTFSKVFDIREIYPAAGPGSNSHMHGCCVDIWHEGGPRLWVHASDGPFTRLWYSDNLGTTWDFVKDENYPIYVNVEDPYNPLAAEEGPPNYVTLDANEFGISLGQDSYPEGTAVILRDENYNENPTVRTATRIDAKYGGDFSPLQYIAESVTKVGDWFFTLHNPSGFSLVPPVITATHVASATGFTVWEGPLDRNNLRKIDYFNGSLWVRDVGSNEMIKIPLYQSGQGKKIRLEQDTGDVLGGKVIGGTWSSLAVGRTTTAGAHGSIAVGMGLEVKGHTTLVIGGYSEVSGVQAISISPGLAEYLAEDNKSKSAGSGVVAIGYRHEVISGEGTVAIGRQVYAEGIQNVVIGREAKSTGSNCVSIGWQASVSGDGSIAIGRNTESLIGGSIAMGRNAKATALSSMAIGYSASSSHNYSIALGRDSETTTASQLHIGNRFIQMGSVQFDPGGKVEGQGQIYFHGPSNTLRVHLPDGTRKTVAFTEDIPEALTENFTEDL